MLIFIEIFDYEFNFLLGDELEVEEFDNFEGQCMDEDVFMFEQIEFCFIYVGIDFGILCSVILVLNGDCYVIESYVGWLIDMVVCKVFKKDVMIGMEVFENCLMFDFYCFLQ